MAPISSRTSQANFEIQKARQLQAQAQRAISEARQAEFQRKRIITHPEEFDAWQPVVTAQRFGIVVTVDDAGNFIPTPATTDEVTQEAQMSWEARRPDLVEKYHLKRM